MYKNPLNNGDLSDYNSLKNQQDNAKIIKKYQSRKLKTEPTELQKYYQYLTYQQSILDELNYVAQRMKDENIQKQKEDFNFIEDLKLRREKTMQEEAKMESTIKEMRESLFNYPSVEIEKDITPTIITDNELETQIQEEPIMITKEEKSSLKIQKAILDKIKRNRAKSEVRQKKQEEENKKEGARERIADIMSARRQRIAYNEYLNRLEEIKSQAETQAVEEIKKLEKETNELRRRGRPKGSKNEPKRTLNL